MTPNAFVVLTVLLLLLFGGRWALQQQFEAATFRATPNQVVTSSTVIVGTETFDVEKAITSDEKTRGLSNRPSLAKNSGLLFIFEPAQEQSFWMREMKFNIDIVWIADDTVVGIERNVPMPLPNTKLSELPLYQPPTAVDYVLEVNAGAADEIKIGDTFSLVTNEGV